MSYRAVTVSTTPTIIASYNPRRISLTILNYSSTTVFISINPTNIISEGFPIDPGVVITLAREDGDNPEYAFYAQTISGYAELRIQEGVI